MSRVMNIRESAEYCGKSVKTIRRWVKQGLKHSMDGQSYVFSQADLDKQVDKGGRPGVWTSVQSENTSTKGSKTKPQSVADNGEVNALKGEVDFLREQLASQAKQIENRDRQMEKMFDKLTDITALVTQQNEKLSLLAQVDNVKKIQEPNQEEVINVSPVAEPVKNKSSKPKKSKRKPKKKKRKKK